jgi:hypothetical protein
VLSGCEIWSAPKWLLPAGVWKGAYGIQVRVDALKKETARLTALIVQVEQEEANKRAAVDAKNEVFERLRALAPALMRRGDN